MQLAKKDPHVLQEKYNTKRGLESLCTTLEGMHEAMTARKRMKDTLQLPLRNFLVAHLWVFSSDGSVFRYETGFNIDELIGPEHFSFVIDIKEVMKEKGRDEEEFFDYFEEDVIRDSYNKLPRIGAICPVCKKGWTVENQYDSLTMVKSNVVRLTPYAGKTYREVKKHLEGKTTPMKQVILTSLEDVHVANSDYVINEDSLCTRTIRKHYHSRCLRVNGQISELMNERGKITTESAFFANMFRQSGYVLEDFAECTDECLSVFSNTWFSVKTTIASFVVSWKNGIFFIVIRDYEHLDLDTLSLDEFNLSCDFKGKLLMEETFVEACAGLKRIKEHLKKNK